AGLHLAGSHQDVGMERGIERYRFGARHGDDDGSRHELIGDGTISRPPLAGLDWLGGDSFDGAGSRSPGAVISDGQLIDRRCSWTRSSYYQCPLWVKSKHMSWISLP